MTVTNAKAKPRLRTGLLKVAELLRVKGLVEEEREKLLNASGKDGRPTTTSSSADHSKLNGPPSEPGSRDPSRERSERERERADQERRGSVASDNAAINHVREREREAVASGLKDGPGGVRPFMLTPPNTNFPLFPLPGLPMVPGVHNLFGANGPRPMIGDRRDDGGDSANEREGSPSPSGANKRRKVASGSGGSSSSKESGPHRDDQPPLVRRMFC